MLEDALSYTPTPRSIRLARHRVAHLVAEWGQPQLAATAALLTSELATNALLHGSLRGRLFRVRVTLTPDVLRIEVSDPRGERCLDESGRGLTLVAALAKSWGVEPRTVGKTVYAELAALSE